MAYKINMADKRDVRALRILEGARQWIKASVAIPGGRVVKAYGIPSESDPERYRLANQRQCNCPDFLNRQPVLCAHIRAVRLYVEWVLAQREREMQRRDDEVYRRAVADAATMPAVPAF